MVLNDYAYRCIHNLASPSCAGALRSVVNNSGNDISGFMLQPTCRRSWARRGRTPTLRCWARHDRLSVIGAVELSPARGRIRLDWQLQRRNLQAEQVVRFVCEQAARYGRMRWGTTFLRLGKRSCAALGR